MDAVKSMPLMPLTPVSEILVRLLSASTLSVTTMSLKDAAAVAPATVVRVLSTTANVPVELIGPSN